MAKTEKEQLEFVTGILTDWDPEGTDTEILYAFGLLADISRSKHKEQWEQLRHALTSNPALDDPWLKQSIRDLSLARKGLWWWNPAQW